MDSCNVQDLQRAILKHQRVSILGNKDSDFLTGVYRVEASENNFGIPNILESPLFAKEQVWTFLRAASDYWLTRVSLKSMGA